MTRRVEVTSWPGVGDHPCLERDEDRLRPETGCETTQVSRTLTYGRKGVAHELLYLPS